MGSHGLSILKQMEGGALCLAWTWGPFLSDPWAQANGVPRKVAVEEVLACCRGNHRYRGFCLRVLWNGMSSWHLRGMSQPASEVPLAVQEDMQEVELQILPLPLLGPLLLLCPLWTLVIREEMDAAGAAGSHAGSPGDLDSGVGGRRKPLVQLATPWPSAGLMWMGTNNSCAGPGAGSLGSWADMEDVISGVLRVLNNCLLGVGAISVGGLGKLPGGSGI